MNAWEAASKGKHYSPTTDSEGRKIVQSNAPQSGMQGLPHSTDVAGGGSAPPRAVPQLVGSNDGLVGANIQHAFNRNVAASQLIRDKADAASLVTLEAEPNRITDALMNVRRLEQNERDHKARVAALEVVLLGAGLSGMVAGDMVGQPHRVHVSSLDPDVFAFLRSRGLC
jgi:hypothetical protein